MTLISTITLVQSGPGSNVKLGPNHQIQLSVILRILFVGGLLHPLQGIQCIPSSSIAQSAGAVEYIDCISSGG